MGSQRGGESLAVALLSPGGPWWRMAVTHKNVPHSWAPSSIFAAFNVVLLITISGLFFSFPCRWLAQHGDWVSPTITGVLFVPTVVSLIFLNFSDPGILHRGSEWQCPLAIKVVWVNRRAFRLQWCQRCCYHRPPRTYHCPWCNICVEDFDHHCKWVNNCIGQRNFRCFMLLVVSLCLYTGALLSACLAFLIRTSQQPLSVDKAFAIVVAVPAAAFMLPLLLLLCMQALSVSSAERSYEVKVYGRSHTTAEGSGARQGPNTQIMFPSVARCPLPCLCALLSASQCVSSLRNCCARPSFYWWCARPSPYQHAKTPPRQCARLPLCSRVCPSTLPHETVVRERSLGEWGSNSSAKASGCGCSSSTKRGPETRFGEPLTWSWPLPMSSAMPRPPLPGLSPWSHNMSDSPLPDPICPFPILAPTGGSI
ncbi:palmitoyltransferase ZDHHC19 isoform X1 [Trichosurus vulpecula]|uniref:palmitoyltransferase ZDHHC19 isoform X1 n=1 Tax=Trichosurus vulpecula TaxID=9337 RepID=UPI00186AC76E|nr:palmitoyltransferase ZDHHC19 isoform X1 [Trichosurus vulpecula]